MKQEVVTYGELASIIIDLIASGERKFDDPVLLSMVSGQLPEVLVGVYAREKVGVSRSLVTGTKAVLWDGEPGELWL